MDFFKNDQNGKIDRSWPKKQKLVKMAKNGPSITNGNCQENSENMKINFGMKFGCFFDEKHQKFNF